MSGLSVNTDGNRYLIPDGISYHTNVRGVFLGLVTRHVELPPTM